MPSLADLQKSAGQRVTVSPLGTPRANRDTSHSPAVLAAMASARGKTGQVVQRHKNSPYHDWDMVEKEIGFTIPPNFRALPVSYLILKQLQDWYVNDTPRRIEESIKAQALLNAQTKTPAWKDESIGGELLPFNLPEDGVAPFRRIPRQRKAYTQIVRELGLFDPQTYRHPNSYAALLPLEAGAGKTAIAAMVIKRYQEQSYFNPHAQPFNNIIYITPKRVKEKTARFFAKAHIQDIGVRVIVTTYNELRSSARKGWYKPCKTIDPNTGEEMDSFTYAVAPLYPSLIIVDESHSIKKPTTATCKRVTALIGPHTRVIFMSATAAVTVNDLATFAIASQKPYNSRPINKNNWREVAWAIAYADPKKPNASAMKRASAFFGDSIVLPPADPRKIKCFNSVKVVDFKTDAQRNNYLAAQERWLEKCERLGKIPSERGAVMAATTVFTAAEELLKAEIYADEAIEELKLGRAPVIGVRYLDTVKEIYGFLMKRVHPLTNQPLTRDNISIIWGGEKIILPEECFTIQEHIRLQQKIAASEDGIDCLDAKTKAKFRKTTRYFQDRWKREGEDGKTETPEAQAIRVRWLKETKLDAQGEAEQQIEVDRFQTGLTDICIFTLSAGGTGIDLDQQSPSIKPRTMISTITYWVEQFVQAFGRCYRISTVSDVYQRVLFFRNTIVADHVAPKLSKKMASTNAFSATGVNLEEDLVNAVLTGKAKASIQPAFDVELDSSPVEQSDTLETEEGDEDESDNN